MFDFKSIYMFNRRNEKIEVIFLLFIHKQTSRKKDIMKLKCSVLPNEFVAVERDPFGGSSDDGGGGVNGVALIE